MYFIILLNVKMFAEHVSLFIMEAFEGQGVVYLGGGVEEEGGGV